MESPVHKAKEFLFGPSVSCGVSTRNSIALTFDDGPSAGSLEIARILAQSGIRATFFLCGVNVMRNPNAARRLHEAGHEIGNHTFNHQRLCPRLGWQCNVLSGREVFREVDLCQQTIMEVTGKTPALVRAPYGLRWLGLRAAQRQLGLLHVLWTVIGHDWEWTAEEVAAHVLANATPGGIVCLHDGRDTRENPDISVTVKALQLIVPALIQRGFTFETVSEILRP